MPSLQKSLSKIPNLPTYLTIIPSIFILISVILLQTGGLDSRKDFAAGKYDEANYHFSLLRWSYTIRTENPRTFKAFHESLFLNTACFTVNAEEKRNGQVQWWKESTHCENLHDKSFPTPNLHSIDSLPDYVWSIRYDSVKVKVTQILYTVAAAFAFVLLLLPILAPFLTRGGADGRRAKVKVFCIVVSALAFILTLTASALLTRQMVKLRDEILEFRSEIIKYVPDATGALIPTTYITEAVDTRIGKDVLALAWTAVVAAAIVVGTWVYSWLSERRGWKSVRLVEE